MYQKTVSVLTRPAAFQHSTVVFERTQSFIFEKLAIEGFTAYKVVYKFEYDFYWTLHDGNTSIACNC